MEAKMNPMINRTNLETMINPTQASKTAKQIDQEEDIVSLLESNIFECILKTLFKENLRSAKESLLNNVGLPTDTRVGYIMYRQKVMDSVKSLYRRHQVHLPEWLED